MKAFVAAFAFLLVTAPASEAVTYRAASLGVEVRVRGGLAAVRYADPVCGLRDALPQRVRRGRFRRREHATCELRPGEARTSVVVVEGRIARAAVHGRIAGRRFVARRDGGRPTAAQLCGLRGATRAETPLVRVFAEASRTLVCRRTDGFRFEIAETIYDEARYYATGVDARFVRASGSSIAYTSAPFDSARSKYAQDPGFATDIVVHDLTSGTLARMRAEVFSVSGFAMRSDRAVAWAGPASFYAWRDVLIQTVQDGRVVTLDRGPIDPKSLRVVDGRFVWDRDA